MYIVNRPISLNHIPNRFFLQIIELEPKDYLKMYEMLLICITIWSVWTEETLYKKRVP